MERRLAAIMLTDIVGYTALMAEIEAKGLRARERHRAVARPVVEKYHGEVVEARGDESLSVFPTAPDAVNCGLAIEQALAAMPSSGSTSGSTSATSCWIAARSRGTP